MSKRSSWITVGVIALILIGSGLATIIAPQIVNTVNQTTGELAPGGEVGVTAPTAPEPETVTIDIPGMFYILGQDMISLIEPLGNLNGTEVEGWQIIVALTIVVVGLVVVATVPLGLVVILGSRSTTRLKEDDGYQEAVRNLESEQETYIKENKEVHPPNEKPDGTMPRWAVISTTLVLMILSYFGGYVFGSAAGANASTWALIFAFIALVICLLTLRPQNILTVDETSYSRPPWASLWVLFSGALIVGLGMGAMYAVITGNNPFVIFTFDWIEANVLSLLS